MPTIRTKSFPPSVLVVTEKGDPGYFHIPDEDTLYAVALHILTERLKSGHFYEDPSDYGPPEEPEYTEQQIEQLPPSLQPEARRSIKRYNARLRTYTHETEVFAQICKAVQEHDGILAWSILRGRSNQEYEYEKIALVPYCMRHHT